MGDITEAVGRFMDLRRRGRSCDRAEWTANGWDIPDIATAYAVQEATIAAHVAAGDRAIGYKIGATNAGARGLLGLDAPFYGVLLDSVAQPAPGRLVFDPAVHRVFEPEIALRLGRDLGPAGAPFTADDLRAATDALLPAIEIIGTAITPWTGAGGTNLIADNGAHGAWIMGTAVTDWTGFDPLDGPVAVTVDGVTTMGAGNAVEGGPFEAAAWLANALAQRGRGLRAGEMLSTGSVIAPVALGSGQRISADYGALGTIRFESL